MSAETDDYEKAPVVVDYSWGMIAVGVVVIALANLGVFYLNLFDIRIWGAGFMTGLVGLAAAVKYDPPFFYRRSPPR